MSTEPFYDLARSYLGYFEHGPLGLFAGTIPASQNSQPKHAQGASA
jgi:hypothetical protein